MTDSGSALERIDTVSIMEGEQHVIAVQGRVIAVSEESDNDGVRGWHVVGRWEELEQKVFKKVKRLYRHMLWHCCCM